MNRPSWLETYLSIAFIVAQRSHDVETQCGCVITDKNNIILGTGYNGFCKGLLDNDLPTTRPAKYPYMRHSEINCLDNCSKRPEDGSIAYITTVPCFNCLQALWQNNVWEIYYTNLYTPKCVNPADEAVRKDFIRRTGFKLELIPIDYTPSLIEKTLSKIQSYDQ